jgi:hypothetical protein
VPNAFADMDINGVFHEIILSLSNLVPAHRRACPGRRVPRFRTARAQADGTTGAAFQITADFVTIWAAHEKATLLMRVRQ